MTYFLLRIYLLCLLSRISSSVTDGGWGEWGAWGDCSKTCGNDGYRDRYRTCDSPYPSNGGQQCMGSYYERDNQCPNTHCLPAIVNGGWGQWQPWNTCSRSCGGNGNRDRIRYCNNPAPYNGGSMCSGVISGHNYQYETDDTCAANDCPAIVNGGWGQWQQWTSCTRSCGGGGSRGRRRYCNNPAPSNGGRMCFGVISGSNYQYETDDTCAANDCPVNGEWGQWLPWIPCSKSCGWGGSRNRKRYCDQPAPSNNGHMCSNVDFGTNYQFENDYACANRYCPVNGGWGEWLSWTPCTKTCGGMGSRKRYRYCNMPAPSSGGLMCSSVIPQTDYEINTDDTCSAWMCPVDGSWTPWSQWSLCSVLCGDGNKTRSRTCDNPKPEHGGEPCSGLRSEFKNCSEPACMEATPMNSIVPSAAGAGGGIIVLMLIIVIIAIITVKRRKKSRHDTTDSVRNDGELEEKNVLVKKGADYNEEHEKIVDNADTEMNTVYCNMSKVETVVSNVHKDDLRYYIEKRKVQNGLQEEYKNIQYGVQYATTMATKKENIPKNRFKTTFPYDHTRVVLTNGPDYINASYIDGFERERCYIASQGPTTATIADHWRMIWQNKVNRIVMLTNLVEGGKKKCEQYWPGGNKSSSYGNFNLTLLSEKTRAAYVTREILVEDKKTKERRTIVQYHFTSWPDHGTPDPLYLVLFHRHVLSEQTESNAWPLLVHCSAGIGRTGTYIGLDALYEQGNTTGYIDVAAFVKKMRYCRMNMVQTADQYVCLHGALLEAFTMTDTNINKNDFGTVWDAINSDTRPVNQQRLKAEFKMLEEKKQEHAKLFQYTVANSPENKEKNRDKSVLPADSNRVFLSSFERGRTDYINAVQAPSYTEYTGYLTTQLPLPDTKVDFWTMIRDQNSSIVVLFLEDHSDADFLYSTTTGSLGRNVIKVLNTSEEEGIRTKQLTLSQKDDIERDIVVYQVACHGLPESALLCKLTNLLSTKICMTESAVTVVSSDGASVCGLFCTFLNAVSSMTIDDNADIFQLARMMQLRRPEFFSDFEEYRKVYEALDYYLDSSNVYANY